MLGLPKSTEFDRRIPKQKFYENLNVTSAMKKSFVEQIKTIRWKNKISASTMNIGAGKNVTEIEVFEIKLTGKTLDENVLKQIDKEIPYHILFLLECGEQCKAAVGYKEATESGSNAFSVTRYFYTDWLRPDELSIKFDGLDIDAVYENIVRQIAGDKLQKNSAERIKESVEREEKRQQIEKQIEVLQAKIRKEKQFNRQMQMNTELKKLKKELEVLV